MTGGGGGGAEVREQVGSTMTDLAGGGGARAVAAVWGPRPAELPTLPLLPLLLDLGCAGAHRARAVAPRATGDGCPRETHSSRRASNSSTPSAGRRASPCCFGGGGPWGTRPPREDED
jgi:hypothetical protein